MCSLNMYLNSVMPITFKPLIQYNSSRRWVLKINNCHVLIRLLKRCLIKFKLEVRLVATLFRCSGLAIKVYCSLQMRSVIFSTKKGTEIYSVT